MPSSGILGRVALVRTNVSEKFSASIIEVTRIGEVGTTLTVTRNRRTLRRNTYIITVNYSHSMQDYSVNVVSVTATYCCTLNQLKPADVAGGFHLSSISLLYYIFLVLHAVNTNVPICVTYPKKLNTQHRITHHRITHTASDEKW
jgi:hypothetical protein